MNTKEILEKNGFTFKKKFGQNFLLDDNILNNIVSNSMIAKDSLVIEVGVGAAALTKKLCKKAGMVLGYEIDKSLKAPLDDILSSYDNVKIIFDDFLDRNVSEDIKDFKYKEIVVVANLPYYITTPIITKFIKEKVEVSRIVVMVQNEVADRFSANIGSKNYNSLTVFLNYYFDVNKLFVVSKNAFYPRPKVDSAVVMFRKKKKSIFVKNEELFFKIVKSSFKQKRKTLKNNLREYDLKKIEKLLEKENKNLNIRAEDLTIEDFANIANELS